MPRSDLPAAAEGSARHWFDPALVALVAQVYEAATGDERARLLEPLLQPLGVLSLVAIADGIFAKIRFRGGWPAITVHQEDLRDVRADHVMALVDHAQQVDPAAVHALAPVLAGSPSLRGTAAAASLMACQPQQCSEQQAVVQPPTSSGGALLGALVGGVVGHNLGEGFGRVAATGLGVVAGSVIGDRAEATNTPAATVPVRNCQTVNTLENRVVGYDVTYDYNGQRYTTRLAQDPGERIALNVSVAPQQETTTVTPVAPAPPVVVSTVVPYPYGYYAAPYHAYYGPIVPRVGVVVGGYWHHGR